VPWPGRRGSSTVKPATANAFATSRIDVGLPAKPWRHSAPTKPPATDQGSAPSMSSVIENSSRVRVVVEQRLIPPVERVASRLPLGERIDAVDRAGGQALVAPRAQLGKDHDVGPVVEDDAELRRAVPQAGVAVDALGHLDPQRQVLP